MHKCVEFMLTTALGKDPATSGVGGESISRNSTAAKAGATLAVNQYIAEAQTATVPIDGTCYGQCSAFGDTPSERIPPFGLFEYSPLGGEGAAGGWAKTPSGGWDMIRFGTKKNRSHRYRVMEKAPTLSEDKYVVPFGLDAWRLCQGRLSHQFEGLFQGMTENLATPSWAAYVFLPLYP